MKNLYLFFTIAFLLLSLAGGIFLVKNNQDNRNRAAGTCSDATRQLCESLIATGDRCSEIGSKECHWIGGTLKTVTCSQYSPNCNTCGINVWLITNQFSCELENGPTPTFGGSSGSCGWDGSKYNSIPLGGA